ncbi:DUF1150 family protein [Polycladidibacter hongkongensis]|uniref:BQ00720 family protein n=1 Tax=Polycladidibacter hongkongensis TaxID=1647556 RepID=UPI0008300433|nr:DUF1150 family protein [Pseudovibrio hongkongensis]
MPRHPSQQCHFASEELFTDYGVGKLSYIREMSHKDVVTLFPDAELEGVELPNWALVSADGTPLILTDNKPAALAEAFEHDLQALSLH